MRLEVGKIDKAHGVKGDVVVTLLSDRTERLDPGSVLFRDDGFELVVRASRPHQHRYIVQFEQIRGREQADDFRGTLLYGDAIEDPDVLWVHDLIGSPVVDMNDKPLGMVESVQENPARFPSRSLLNIAKTAPSLSIRRLGCLKTRKSDDAHRCLHGVSVADHRVRGRVAARQGAEERTARS